MTCHLLQLFVLLILYLISDSITDANDEERIVVEKLASIIRQQEQAKFENAESDIEKNDDTLPYGAASVNKEAEGVEPPFTYEARKPITMFNVPEVNKSPMAVPPSDFRFFQNGTHLSLIHI